MGDHIPRQGVLDGVSVERVLNIADRHSFIPLCSRLWCDVTSGFWFLPPEFTTVMDCDLELSHKINPFFPRLLFNRVFYNNR